jgi:LuxR family maltose regulon positive regulatory protein
MPVSLLSTKLYIPHAQPDAVLRPRLTEKLRTGLNRPGCFALLSGPAGFGKTTLLSELVGGLPRPPAWLSLDEGDNDPIRFWSYVITACQTVHKGVGESARSLLAAPQPLLEDAIPTILINDLAQLEADLVLVLDDFHVIENPSIHTGVSFLLDHMPENFHIVLSTRSDPPLPMARFRARNRLVEIRAKDLRFTTGEAAAFLNQRMDLKLSPADVAALEARTEGWIAGLQLAAISMQGRTDITGFVKAFTGSHIFVAEYLIEEVLSRQAEEVQSFLLQTSILERLNASLCEAITERQDGQDVLDSLRRLNLFVIPLDDEGQWFRYHRLFADLLQARLRQVSTAEGVALLHSRAAGWYEQASMVGEAIHHALAAASYTGDYAAALRLIENHTVEMLAQGYASTVVRWLNSIPGELRFQSPRTNMAFVWMYLMRGAFDQVMPHVERLKMFFTAPQMESTSPSLQAEWLAVQSYLMNAQNRPAESLELAKKALEVVPEGDNYVRSLAYNALGMAYLLKDEYARAVETYQKAIQHGRAAGNSVSEILGVSILIQISLQHGRYHLAFETATEGINQIERLGAYTPISAAAYGALGQVYYQWHQLENSHNYYQRAIQMSATSGYSDAEIGYAVLNSRLMQAEGDLEASARELQKAVGKMQAIPPAWTREEVISQQVRVSLAHHRPEAAESALKAGGFAQGDLFSIPALDPERSITFVLGQLYNSALRLLLYRGKVLGDIASLRQGIELADRLIERALHGAYLPIALEALLLRAQLHAARGEDQANLADVCRALELAEPEGFISIFIEEGLPITEALEALLKHSGTGVVQPEYIRKILAAFPRPKLFAKPEEQPAPLERAQPVERPLVEPEVRPAENLLVESLSPRELEVLRLICEGCSNQEIAARLVLSLHTVKKHSSNIFTKLGVNSRTQAAARARQLHLL